MDVRERGSDGPKQINQAFSLEDFEPGEIAVTPGWLNEVWGKLPGGESIQELLEALKGG